MDYPSLLNMTAPQNKPCDFTVFEDIKLTNLLGEDVIEAIKFPLESDNILARQDLFAELENADFLESVRGLYDRIETVAAYNDRASNASCEIERKCAFVGLMKAYTEFCRAASALKGSTGMSKRFADFFAAETSKQYFLRLENDIAAVYPRIEEMSRHLFMITGENLKVSVNPPDSFVSRIAKCASDLGLEELPSNREAPRALAAPIIEAAIIEAASSSMLMTEVLCFTNTKCVI